MALCTLRIGSNNLIISDHPDDPSLCYTWRKWGPEKANGKRFYVCSKCRKMRETGVVPKHYKLPTRLVIDGTWQDEGPNHRHFCQPIPRNRLFGKQVICLKAMLKIEIPLLSIHFLIFVITIFIFILYVHVHAYIIKYDRRQNIGTEISTLNTITKNKLIPSCFILLKMRNKYLLKIEKIPFTD
jgi:hypothetical protein